MLVAITPHHLHPDEEHCHNSQSPEEQRLLRIGIEPDIVGRAAVRLHDADGINQRDGGLRLRTSKKKKTKSPNVSLPQNRNGCGRVGGDLGGGGSGGYAG